MANKIACKEKDSLEIVTSQPDVEPVSPETDTALFAKIPHPKKRAFLAAFCMTGILSKAAQIAGVDRSSHYHWLKDRDYREAFEFAKKAAGDNLESLAFERAQDKSDPGSTTLLIFLLKGAKPEKYRERVSTDHSLNVRQEVEVYDPGRDVLSDEVLDALIAEGNRLLAEKNKDEN